jgi:hypothetical protein
MVAESVPSRSEAVHEFWFPLPQSDFHWRDITTKAKIF